MRTENVYITYLDLIGNLKNQNKNIMVIISQNILLTLKKRGKVLRKLHNHLLKGRQSPKFSLF